MFEEKYRYSEYEDEFELTDIVTCPWCDQEHEKEEEEFGEVKCDNCNKIFEYKKMSLISYFARKKRRTITAEEFVIQQEKKLEIEKEEIIIIINELERLTIKESLSKRLKLLKNKIFNL